MDLDRVLEDDNFQRNFDEMIRQMKSRIGDGFNEPDDNLKNILKHIHTTHTFPLEMRDKQKMYKDILFCHKALLSQQYRKSNSLYKINEKPANLGKADFLNNYIFAYLGMHDCYYTYLEHPAFGVFLPPSIEDKYKTNATRRDLSSPQSLNDSSKEFFSSELARIYAAYQIANEHENFWDYWGNYDKIINDETYEKNRWKFKIEFHYLEKVNCCDFAALLWPVREVKSQDENQLDPDMLNEIKEFEKNNPTVRVYPYIWKANYPTYCFYYASYLITKYFYEEFEYISLEEFKIKFTRGFKGWRK